MAAKPKLTPEEWEHAKDVWECDSRKGFPWLIKELGLSVSAEAIRLRSKSEGWKKRDKPSLENKKSKLGKKKKNPSFKDAPDEQDITDVRVSGKTDYDSPEGHQEGSNIHGNSKYSTDYSRQVYELCLLGATDLEIANFFGVSESTINKWKLDHRSFSESLKGGKIVADARMAHRFYVKGCGFRYTEIRTRTATGDDGKEVPIEVITTEKEALPDAGAAYNWLKNRRPENWRDRIETSVDVKLDKEALEEIERTFLVCMQNSRERQNKILIERGILIEQEKDD